ncbi:putative RING-H2 finger protein ATL71-like [Capsicum annuum]|uniref:protein MICRORCHIDIA 7-like n=1 Tax=Capsicum annuum TaxID=4072 RepID=UPI001FB13E81|nr:protein MICRORCHIDIA 7-like [Capsicum annuum]KAF3644088.1 putative RING-H2 finger protein ATL71-like [Capsicum annuum]
MITIPIKQEIIDLTDDLDDTNVSTNTTMHIVPITNYGVGSCFLDIQESPVKKMKLESEPCIIAPLSICPKNEFVGASPAVNPITTSCKQFWKAGDYDGNKEGACHDQTVGMDHVRVHPKFLHSNATSHKWALGAFAELLDNAMDEVCNGATYVSVDVLDNKKDVGSKMLLVEDDGGGMTPDRMRQCMSLGYSAKSKLANTIGQYGNGFKTSSMRLGADVIVFSRGRDRATSMLTQSVGMLSYTFLRGTGKEDIVVPMVDFVKRGGTWEMLVRSSADDWKRNSETITQWSPYENEQDLLQQFEFLKGDHGTRIVIYNLWEDEEGATELDFDTNAHDIQIRGVSRDEKKIEMAKEYPNSRHFLTYQHSLRSYASILYLRLAPGFQIILRGKEVEHHNLVNDMMLSEEITYRPQSVGYETSVAEGTIGFVKDAKHHIDIQGFNVYHKNRLIKPFWRVWNAAGSDGRGVIGVLEANFVEPAHDKQGFERTIVLARLEARLQFMQKKYWSSNCHFIGYAKRRNVKNTTVSPDQEEPNTCSVPTSKSCSPFSSNVSHTTCHDERSKPKSSGVEHEMRPVHSSITDNSVQEASRVYVGSGEIPRPVQVSAQARRQTMYGEQNQQVFTLNGQVDLTQQVCALNRQPDLTQQVCRLSRQPNITQQVCTLNRQPDITQQVCILNRQTDGTPGNTTCHDDTSKSKSTVGEHENWVPVHSSAQATNQTMPRDHTQQASTSNSQTSGNPVVKMEDIVSNDLRAENNSIKNNLQQVLRHWQHERATSKSLARVLLEERKQRATEGESLRSKLKDASVTIQDLLNKVRLLQSSRITFTCKTER